jgi:hypothetical protein
MTREKKKSDDEEKKKQRKKLVGKSHTYRQFSIAAVPWFRPANEKWLNNADKISPLGGPNGKKLIVLDSRICTEKTH